MDDTRNIDTLNRFMVASGGGKTFIMHPPLQGMTREEATSLAAWIVAIADPTRELFDAALDAVLKT